MQRLILTMLLVITLGAKTSSSEPLSEAGFEVVTERVYRLGTLEAEEIGAFLDNETYPVLPEHLYHTCKDTIYATQNVRDQNHTCISAKFYRSRYYPDLLFSLEKISKGNVALMLWIDTPLWTDPVEVIFSSQLTPDEPLILVASQSAELSNSDYDGRFLEELRVEFGRNSYKFGNYNSYGDFNSGHGLNGSTSNFKTQETWMTQECRGCLDPVFDAPSAKKK